MGVLARRRLRRDARAARQQGRKSRRDDAGTGYREGARWLHHHHRCLRRIHAQRRPAACWSRGPDRRCRRGAGARKRQALRRSRRPAAALRAVGRPGIDARHARHDPEPRVDRVVGGRSHPAHRPRPLCLGLPPAPRADVLRGGQGSGRCVVRDCPYRGARGGGCRPRQRPRRDRGAGFGRALPRHLRQPHRGSLPRGSAGPASLGGSSRVRLLEQRARHHLPSAQRHPR